LTPIPALYKGFPLHPADEKDPYIFALDFSEWGMGAIHVVFSRDPGTGATALHLDFQPLSLHKQPARTNPRVWITRGIGALGVIAAAGAARRHSTRAGRATPGVG
jgi:hypothetical protein